MTPTRASNNEALIFLERIRHSAMTVTDFQLEAIGVGGSYGQYSEPDEYSDVDLFLLLVEFDALRDGPRIRQFFASQGEVILARGPIWVDGYGFSFSFLYRPFLICQANINTRQSLSAGPERKYTEILFDRTGFLSDFTNSQANVETDYILLFESSSSLFWFRALNVWRDSKRGQLWLALRHLEEARRQLLTLIRLIRQCPARDFRVPERKLEQEVDVLALRPVHNLVARYDRQSIMNALQLAVKLHQEWGRKYADEIGVTYPYKAAESVEALIMNEDRG
jgi:hypothetical protein